MEKENKKYINLIIVGIIMMILLVTILSFIGKKNTDIPNDEEKNIDNSETLVFDENAINEIKDNIDNLEIEYIGNNDKAKEYAEGIFTEIKKINIENYKKYFQDEEEYGKYVSETFTTMCGYVNNLVQDFSKAKIDTKTFSNRILPLLEQGNNFIDYMQENPNIFFKESYTNIRKAKYDSLQKEISSAYIFFDMDFAQYATDIINAYNSQELPNNKDIYRERAKKVANGIFKLKDNTSNVVLNKFVNENYTGDVDSITESILSDINTFSSFTNTYNSTSGTAVSNLVTNYGELLTLIGDDIKY